MVGKILHGKHPERVVEKAVERMLPKGPLGKKQLSNLYVYAGPEHKQAAQQPQPLDVAALAEHAEEISEIGKASPVMIVERQEFRKK